VSASVCGYFEWQACNTNVVEKLLETSLSNETVEENLTFIGVRRSVLSISLYVKM
jgi:hypothetical protein